MDIASQIAYSDFSEAKKDWNLKDLLTDIHKVMLTPLGDRKEKILRGLLCDYSPEKIARDGYGNPNSRAISPEISELYRCVELLAACRQTADGDNASQVINSGNILRGVLRDLGYHKSNSQSGRSMI
jgi:hypothetical protein